MNNEMKEILIKQYKLDEFKQNLIGQDKGLQTVNTYFRNCLFFFYWLFESNGDVPLDQVTEIDVRDYKSFLLNVRKL